MTRSLEELLPPKDDTDTMISFYLNRVEKLHRIIHIPTFSQEYSFLWESERPRHPGMVALVLAMMSVSLPILPVHLQHNFGACHRSGYLLVMLG